MLRSMKHDRMSIRWFTRIRPLATAFSVAGTPILPIYNQAAVFAPETPIFPSPRLIYTIQDGKEICATLGERMAMLLKGMALLYAAIAWNMLRFTRSIWNERRTCNSWRAEWASQQSCRRSRH